MRALKFNEVKVVVNCQYFENYGSNVAPHWKPKGGVDFSFIVDSDEWFYCEDEIKSAAERAVANKNNTYCRLEVVGYETIFEEPKDITYDVVTLFKEAINKANEEALLKVL